MKRYLLGLTAIALVFAGSAFTKNQKATIEQWHFKANEPIGNARMASSYELLSTVPTPNCTDTKIVPCIVEFDNEDPTTSDLAEYLNGFASDAALVAVAASTRSN